MDLAEAAQTLKLKLPTTPNALKTAYRRRSFEEHPDQSQHPQANERFLAVAAAYNYLKDLPEAISQPEADDEPQVCTDGTPLNELGLGLGPLKNGRTCDLCDGRGYTSMHIGSVPCAHCEYHVQDGLQGWRYRCSACEGTREDLKGRPCRKCKGAGNIFIPFSPRHQHTQWWYMIGRPKQESRCNACHGDGMVPSKRRCHYKCGTCKGCGEIEIWNPVLPKGLLRSK